MKLRTFLFGLAIFALGGCVVSEGKAAEVLVGAGFKPVRFLGYQFGVCGEDDVKNIGFIATNFKGQEVRGTLCCGGLFKGCTIRY
jgi:hypothetical protein